MKKLIAVSIALIGTPALANADRIAKLDKDGDNRVSLIELSEKYAVKASLFEKADKNSDGVLSASELRAARHYLLREEKKA